MLFGDFGELTRTACLIPRFKTGDIYIYKYLRHSGLEDDSNLFGLLRGLGELYFFKTSISLDVYNLELG